MNTRNLLLKAVLASSLLTSCGCMPKKSGSVVHAVNDGTYTGIGNGYNGYIVVSATFRNGNLTNISVDDAQETVAVSDSALAKIPEHVIRGQSLNVDVSTGATVTSKGILEAIGNAIVSANGDISQWQDDFTGNNVSKVIEEKSDVTVVGGGAAGIAAVLRLQEKGYRTTLIEKSNLLGGSLRYLSNSGQLVIGSSKTGMENVNSADQLAEEISVYGNHANRSELAQLFEENIGSAVDWEIDVLGLTFDKKTGCITTEGISGNAVMLFDETSGNIDELLQKEVEVSGASVHTSAGIIDFRYNDSGDIIGVTAKKANGDIVQTTSDYVIMATGTYAGNLNLISERDRHSHYIGLSTNSGDAVLLAKNEEHPYLIEEQDTVIYNYLGLTAHEITLDTHAANQSILKKGLVIVNNSSERFVDESLSYNEISGAIAGQNNAVAYLVMNESGFHDWRKELLANATLTKEEEVFLSAEFSILPYIGENIEEAAISADLNGEKLRSAVELRNAELYALAENNENAKGMIDPKKPICIIPIGKYRYETAGGLQVDEDLHILDGDANPVLNVFAAGSIAGNVFGDRMPGGAGIAWAFVSGKYVADMIDRNYRNNRTDSRNASQ